MAVQGRRSGCAAEVLTGDRLWYPVGDGEYAVRTVVHKRRIRPGFDRDEHEDTIFLWFAEDQGRRHRGEEGQTVYWATEADIAAAPPREKKVPKR